MVILLVKGGWIIGERICCRQFTSTRNTGGRPDEMKVDPTSSPSTLPAGQELASTGTRTIQQWGAQCFGAGGVAEWPWYMVGGWVALGLDKGGLSGIDGPTLASTPPHPTDRYNVGEFEWVVQGDKGGLGLV
eukprot:746214-Hanusia_phi.AAC.4